jgi:superfamily II DNA or RNA helicase
MQSSVIMPGMSYGKNTFRLRKGQHDLGEYLPNIKTGDRLTVTWPPGYGKSAGFAMAWKYCEETKIANRLLLIVANDTQRQQIINDFRSDCNDVGAPCRGGVWEFERSAGDIRTARDGKSEVFVCTVQQLEASNHGGLNILKDLLTANNTQWMIGFDEFHHYGEDMPWGDAAKVAMQYASFVLAMSATPYRRGPDFIFPEPRLTVTYSEAVTEKAIKPMVCHTYDYRVTVIDANGETQYTTSELLEEAPEGIDKWEERRHIRYSPEYIHPLIIHPLTRLMLKRGQSGQRLQMLIRAMSCSHAEMVCEQVKQYTSGGMTVDWIGTGPHGRSQETNDNIRRAFCPQKECGVRPIPKLDILVQVSMAGEGFDSINVAEIVDLFPVSKRAATGRATQDKQFYGRGSRIVPNDKEVILHVSVPSDHPLQVWGGKELHRWMDSSGDDIGPREEDKEREPPDIDWFDFPELPRKREIELLNITTEDENFIQFAKEAGGRRGWDLVLDKQELFEIYRNVCKGVAEESSEQARMYQVRELLDCIIGRISYIKASRTGAVGGNIIGQYKKDLNQKIKSYYGKSREEMSIDEMELAFTYCQDYLKKLKG